MEAETQRDKNPTNSVAGVELPAVIKSEDEEARGGGEAKREKKGELEDKKKDWVIDVKRSPLSSSSSSSGEEGNLMTEGGGERECRICHLSTDDNNNNRSGRCEYLIELGCGCKGELGVSHLRCAHTWFRLNGNRFCDICGKQARNITGVEEEDGRIMMLEWESVRLTSIRRRRSMATTLPKEENDWGRCGQRFCNILLVCLVLAFIVPWLFRISML